MPEKHYIRVSFYVKNGKFSLTKFKGAWCFETLWLNGKLIEWNLVGIQPTRENIGRCHSSMIFYLRNILATINVYPKVLWPEYIYLVP